jgi:L-aminopeptidase/D-esterase-like protein
MSTQGKYNSLTDVAGIIVGHYTDRAAASGVTVMICEAGAVAGVDVRGAAPGTRETDLLEPANLVDKVQAIVLSGGSVYGLAASDGVVRWLSKRGIGYPLDETHVAPIVPAAVLFDLGRGSDFIPPVDYEWGWRACEAAGDGPVPMGCFGAGTGAVSGAIKGGVGSASLVLDSGITVAAMVAVNSLGSVINPETGAIWESGLEVEREFGGQGKRKVRLPSPPGQAPAKNTTIGIVATDATITKAQAQKLAQMAQDGLARAIRPSHTMFDGDTIFCIATGKVGLPDAPGVFAGAYAQAINEIGHAASNCVARAIIRGILAAETLKQFTAFRDLEDLIIS